MLGRCSAVGAISPSIISRSVNNTWAVKRVMKWPAHHVGVVHGGGHHGLVQGVELARAAALVRYDLHRDGAAAPLACAGNATGEPLRCDCRGVLSVCHAIQEHAIGVCTLRQSHTHPSCHSKPYVISETTVTQAALLAFL